MKVKFAVLMRGHSFEEVVSVSEKTIKGEGFQPRNNMNNLLESWILSQVVTDSYYQILDDERFTEEPNNLPYIDYMASKRLGWFE